MSLNVLQNIWFVLWCVIWTAYFIFDSYTLGIGMLFPFVTKDRADRNLMQEIVGPFWNGAEVWLVLAGGATFAAFPAVYGEMFSMLYVPFYLILFGLIFRAVGLELMHKDDNPRWVSAMKWAFICSSYLVSFLFGVLFANLFSGIAFNEQGLQTSLGGLFNTYAILSGLMFVSMFLTAGALWISIKTEGSLTEVAIKIARRVAPAMLAIISIVFVATANRTNMFDRFNEKPMYYIIPILSLIVASLCILQIYEKRFGHALTGLAGVIALTMATGFVGNYPSLLPSSLGEQFSLTLHNSSASRGALQLMFVVAVIFVPIVLGYQTWVQFLFRKKVKKEDAVGYH